MLEAKSIINSSRSSIFERRQASHTGKRKEKEKKEKRKKYFPVETGGSAPRSKCHFSPSDYYWRKKGGKGKQKKHRGFPPELPPRS